VSRDPLSAQALYTLATVEQARGRPLAARATLLAAVRLQPSNPQTWLTLGEFDLARAHSQTGSAAATHATLDELAAAIYLNPELIAPEAIAAHNQEAITAENDYVQALRATMPAAAGGSAAPAAASGAARPSAASGRNAAPAGTPNAARRAARRARSRARRAARGQ
jgi:hypothetical protein